MAPLVGPDDSRTRAQKHLLTYLETHMDAIVDRPEDFGPPLSVELLYLQACEFYLEVRHLHRRGLDGGASVTERWSAILERHTYRGAAPLAGQILGYDRLQELLPELRQSVSGTPSIDGGE